MKQETENQERVDAQSTVLKARRILIVDDDPRLCNSLKLLLELHGYQCAIAIGGRQAIEALKKTAFDLMLLDLKMPDVDGRQVMSITRRCYPGMDVIIVSGERNLEQVAWAKEMGARDFIGKPHDSGVLIQAIEKSFQENKTQSESRVRVQPTVDLDQQYRFIVDSSPDIIYMLDSEGRFSFVNERISALLGYKKEEIIGKHHSEIIFQEDLRRVRFVFPEKRTGERACRGVEFRLLKKTNHAHFNKNRTIPVELNAMGVYGKGDTEGSSRFVGTYGVMRDISERKQAEEVINYQLYHDLLTALPNRTLFRDRLEVALSQARRMNRQLAVMFLDLDGFKLVNDSLGHLIGDELLQAVANRLSSTLRDSDTLARVGGDEFNLLLPEISGVTDAEIIARKIIKALRQPFLINKNELSISISIGIAIFPEDGQNIETLIRNADMAMYHIKGRGKNGYEFFTNNMISRVAKHFSLESGLHKALNKGEFSLVYQPQFHLQNETLSGVEALIRWRHPTEGVIFPDDFIPLAEENGMISELGDWVIDAACEALVHWRKGGQSNLIMAINLSAAQLYRTDFIEKILAVLTKYNIPGHCLELEITENVLMQDMEHVVQKLNQLTEEGIGIVVDDFGTGYSSLSYLQTLPLSKLKIDRSFVKQIHSKYARHSIVSAVVAMARDLGLNLTAEGVENEEQLDYLRKIACPQVQGFLLSPPVSAEKLVQFF